MIIIECKNIPRVGDTLILSNDVCTIQCADDDSGLLDEYIIPVYFDDGKFRHDVHISIDEVILSMIETGDFIKIYEQYLQVGTITYDFKKSEKTIFETQLPPLAFIGVLPNLELDCEVTLEHTYIVLDSGITHRIITIYEKDPTVYKTRINGKFLEPGLCKVYKEENFMTCLEYSHSGYIKRRFIAPIVEYR